MSPPKMDWKCLLSHIVRSPQYDHTECYDEGYIQVAVLDMDVWFICSALFILLSLSQTLPSELTLHCETYFLWLIFCFLKHRKKLCVIFVCVLNSETFPGNVFSTTIKMFHFLLSLLVSVASPPTYTPLVAPVCSHTQSLLKPQTPKNWCHICLRFLPLKRNGEKRNVLIMCVCDGLHLALLSHGALVWFSLASGRTSLRSVCRPSLHFWTVTVCVHEFNNLITFALQFIFD